MGINERACWQNKTLLDEYLDDMSKALTCAEDHAGEKIDNLDLVDSEIDRLQMLREEFESLSRKVHEVMDCYENLAKDTDEAIKMLGGEI